ncbi:MAG: hypothetical protein ACE5EI_09605 [Thermodesulfobacteriota bacterium]
MDEFKDGKEIREYVIRWLSAGSSGKDDPRRTTAGLAVAGKRVDAILRTLHGEKNAPGAQDQAAPAVAEGTAHQTKPKEI